ncbi:hypothetical protein ES705_20934 [subsurface metagenome]
MEKIGEMDISGKMKLKVIGKEIHNSKKKYIQKLKLEDPGAYTELRKSQKKGLAKFRKKNPNYQKNWAKKQSREGKE